jgi:hypothetical protein
MKLNPSDRSSKALQLKITKEEIFHRHACGGRND